MPQVTGPQELAGVVRAVRQVYRAAPLVEYVLDVVSATRRHPEIALGASPPDTGTHYTITLKVGRRHVGWVE